MTKKIFIGGLGLVVLVSLIYLSSISSGEFKSLTSNTPLAQENETVVLEDGDTYDLVASIVKKNIAGREIKMLAYNGSIPGPSIKVKQGSEITINLKNETDVDTSLHSHGVRLDSKYDGVVGIDQDVVRPGETFIYKIKFPDAGIFWYHPHFREDYAQELGLYGNYIVTSESQNYLPPVNKEELIVLDDILLDENGTPEFSKNNVNYTLMGRFGNVMIVNGKTDYSLSLNSSDVVRFYFTNVANTRTFRVSIPGAKMKLVAGDQSKYERETFVDNVVVAPSERVVVGVIFPRSGEYRLTHTTPIKKYDLGIIKVTSNPSKQSFAGAFNILRTNDDVVKDIDDFRPYFNKTPDKKLRLAINMGENMGSHQMSNGGMMSNQQMMMDISDDGIEWEDSMSSMNKAMDATTEWQIIADATGKKNMDIDWVFSKNDKVKIEIFNDPHSMHPMQHPIHFHGQRFLVLSINGVRNINLVWKDTVLVRAGDRVEILLDASNPGDWMAHCHIAEHLEASMMFLFRVSA